MTHGFVFEVRPEQVGEVQLGIGQLPQQKIADAMLATGADTQIRQRQITRYQAGLQQGRGDLFWLQLPLLNLTSQLLRSLCDVPLTTIVGSNLQHKAIGAHGHFFRFTHRLL